MLSLPVSLRVRTSIVLSVLAAACSAAYPTAPTKPAPVALQVHFGARGPVPPAGPGGMTWGFQAYSLDTDGAYEFVTTQASWLSSDETVVRRVSTSPPTFMAVAPGAARIIARYEGLEASAWMIVTDPQLQTFPRLVLNPGSPGSIGRSAQAIATLERSAGGARENVTSRVMWTSADPGVATIDQNGVITAVGLGTTLITASLDDLTTWYWLSIAPSL